MREPEHASGAKPDESTGHSRDKRILFLPKAPEACPHSVRGEHDSDSLDAHRCPCFDPRISSKVSSLFEATESCSTLLALVS